MKHLGKANIPQDAFPAILKGGEVDFGEKIKEQEYGKRVGRCPDRSLYPGYDYKGLFFAGISDTHVLYGRYPLEGGSHIGYQV